MPAGKNYEGRREENIMNNAAMGSCVSVLMHHAGKMGVLVFFAVLIYCAHGASAEAASKEDCITRHQKKAKCQAATYIINETCKCKFDSTCRYPNSKAIECILDNIGDVQDNSAAYLMRNSCIQKNLLTGQ